MSGVSVELWEIPDQNQNQNQSHERSLPGNVVGFRFREEEEEELSSRHDSIFNYYCCVISNISVRRLHVSCVLNNSFACFLLCFLHTRSDRTEARSEAEGADGVREDSSEDSEWSQLAIVCHT